MLFEQIPLKRRRRFVAAPRTRSQVVSLSLRENPNDETRYSKLNAVERHIRDQSEVGTIDEPLTWFAVAKAS
jgi:hypothetical protein